VEDHIDIPDIQLDHVQRHPTYLTPSDTNTEFNARDLYDARQVIAETLGMDYHHSAGGGDCLLHSIRQGFALQAPIHNPVTLSIPSLRRAIHHHMLHTRAGRAIAARGTVSRQEIDLILPRTGENEWLEMWAVESLQSILQINIFVHYIRTIDGAYTHSIHWLNPDPTRLTFHVLHSGNQHFDYLHPHQIPFNPP
jgi:hypothetical protein